MTARSGVVGLLSASYLLATACEGGSRAPAAPPAVMAGPAGHEATPGGSAASCPAEAALGALHAAAFEFEHGTAAAGRAQLLDARERLGREPAAEAARLLAELEQVSSLIERDPLGAKQRTEELRVTLGDWSCIGEALHERLHAALPPVPGG